MGEEEEEKGGDGVPHVVALPYPSQGHISPMLQFCKRLKAKSAVDIRITFLLTNFISNSFSPSSSSSSAIRFETISDGYDQGGFQQAGDVNVYLARLQEAGSQSLARVIDKHRTTPHPVTCIVYDAFLPWALDVVHGSGLDAATFFTQPCAVNYIYYYAHHGLLPLPVSPSSLPVSIPGMPLLQLHDMPSFICTHGSYPGYFRLVLNQFSNLHRADYVLVNTFYRLEEAAVDAMSRISPLMTIGPTVPSSYLNDDERVENDDDYGLHLYHLTDSSAIFEWLDSKPTGSVVFVSFGSMACLEVAQMEELAGGLKGLTTGGNEFYFLWVVRATEEGKLPEKFREEMGGKGLLVRWSPQLQVLSRKAVGCFFSHAGWNSVVEALSLGVPMVVMPQWTDQTTNAKFVEDVWKVGVRVRVDTESGLVGRREIETRVREVMGGIEMKKKALEWRDLAKDAVREGGSSDNNIRQFVSKLTAASV